MEHTKPEQDAQNSAPGKQPTPILSKAEQDRLTRRQALRKLGFGAGMATFMLLGVDDFARMAGKQLQQMAGDSKVASQVAGELRGAGVVLADGSSPLATLQPCGIWEGEKQKDACDNCSLVLYKRCKAAGLGTLCDTCQNNADQFCLKNNYSGWYQAWQTCFANP